MKGASFLGVHWIPLPAAADLTASEAPAAFIGRGWVHQTRGCLSNRLVASSPDFVEVGGFPRSAPPPRLPWRVLATGRLGAGPLRPVSWVRSRARSRWVDTV